LLKIKNIVAFILIAFLLLAIYSCSRKKNTFTRRAYHNTTAHYNGYFNAREILKADVKELYYNHKDDFSELIPLFVYPDEAKSKSMYPNMERVIDKTTNVIDRHSIYLKNEEHIRWIDDSYMLMGKARFYKQEYYIAVEVFEYIAKAYKKKPTGYEGMIWLARTYIELNELNKAEAVLKKLEESGAVPKQLSSEFNAVFATYYIKKNNREEAITKLSKALETTRGKRDKVRFNYVLAQLWLKQKEYEQASIYFGKVIKLKPNYETLFNAKISKALAYDTKSEGKDGVKKMLKKMLKDIKNEDYKDQIYFALADIEFKEENDSLGIAYLQKSVASSTTNSKQKALSYLRLGNYFYEIPKYVKSYTYYDSSLVFLPKEHVDFDKINERTKALKKLVDNIYIVQEEDSLQRLANDEGYRNKIINELAQKAKDDELASKQQASMGSDDDFFANNKNSSNSTNKGAWYFYNQNTLGFGFTDFRKKWGERKLEDNWRRSNKETIMPEETIYEEELSDSAKSDTTKTKIDAKTTPEYYLQFIPLTDEKMVASHNKIIEALYALGNIYKEDFQDYPNSIASFEELISRYDTSGYVLPSWFNLYRVGLLIKDDAMELKYKNLVLNNYPESEYAKIILNPNYNKVTRETRRRVDNYYTIVYDLFRERYYDKVILRCATAKTIFAENHLQDKFDFLAALAVGHTSPVDTFKLALETFIMNHPQSESKPEAEKMLGLIKTGIKVEVEEQASNVPYNHVFSDKFMVVIVVPNADKELNNYKSAIADFNKQNYGSFNFEPIKTIFLDANNQLIMIKELDGDQIAIDYYKAILLNKDLLQNLNTKEYASFIISNDNFNMFYKDKNVENYLKFFNKNFNIEIKK